MRALSWHGKKAAEAKTLELNGWNHPRQLAGRSYAVIVHGDSAGTEAPRRSLCDWLNDMDLIQGGAHSCIDSFIDTALHEEVRNAARALCRHVQQRRNGLQPPDASLEEPRPK
jgi:hypothetical protein